MARIPSPSEFLAAAEANPNTAGRPEHEAMSYWRARYEPDYERQLEAEYAQGAEQGFAADFADEVGASFVDSFAGTAYLAGEVLDSDLARDAADGLYGVSADLRDSQSQAWKEGQQAEFFTETEQGEHGMGDAWTNARAWANLGANALGFMGGTMATGGPVKGLFGAGLKKVMKNGTEKLIKQGMSKEAAKDATLQSLQRMNTAAGTIAYGAAETSTVLGNMGHAVEEEIMGMDRKSLLDSPAYVEIEDALRDSMPAISTEQRETLAKEILAKQAAISTMKDSAIPMAALGLAGGRITEALLARGIGGASRKANVARGMGAEGLQEASQGGSEQVFQNLAIQEHADPSRRATQGLLNAAFMEGVGGMGMGGGMGAFSKVDPAKQKVIDDLEATGKPIDAAMAGAHRRTSNAGTEGSPLDQAAESAAPEAGEPNPVAEILSSNNINAAREKQERAKFFAREAMDANDRAQAGGRPIAEQIEQKRKNKIPFDQPPKPGRPDSAEGGSPNSIGEQVAAGTLAEQQVAKPSRPIGLIAGATGVSIGDQVRSGRVEVPKRGERQPATTQAAGPQTIGEGNLTASQAPAGPTTKLSTLAQNMRPKAARNQSSLEHARRERRASKQGEADAAQREADFSPALDQARSQPGSARYTAGKLGLAEKLPAAREKLDEKVSARRAAAAREDAASTGENSALADAMRDAGADQLQEPSIQLRKNGQPFVSEKGAQASAAFKAAESAGGSPAVVEVEGGYGVEIKKSQDVLPETSTPVAENQNSVADTETQAPGELPSKSINKSGTDASRRPRAIRADIDKLLRRARGKGSLSAEQAAQLDALNTELEAADTVEAKNPVSTHMRKNGQPFKSAKAAKASAVAKEIEQSGGVTEVVEVEGGYALESRRDPDEVQGRRLPAGEKDAAAWAKPEGSPTASTNIKYSEQPSERTKAMLSGEKGKAIKGPAARHSQISQISHNEVGIEILGSAIDDVVDAGIPTSVLSRITKFGVIDNPQSSLLGAYYPRARAIGINMKVFSSVATKGADSREGHILRQYVAHELAHEIDFRGTNQALSHSSPAFGIPAEAVSLKQEGGYDIDVDAVGEVMGEAVLMWHENKGGFKKMLNYPLAALESSVRDGATDTLKSEVFAQLMAIHTLYPGALKKHAPQAHALMQEIKDAENQHSGQQADAAVREAFQSAGADVGAAAGAGGSRASGIGGTGRRQAGQGVGDRSGSGQRGDRDAGSVGSDGVSAQARSGAAEREADGSLVGLPRIRGAKASKAISRVAQRYMESAGLEYNPPNVYAPVNRERAQRIAAAYDEMKHDPQNPEVLEAYEAMIAETEAQYEAALNAGLEVEFIDFSKTGDPYSETPRQMTDDVVNNNHMWVFSTRDGFGSDESFDPLDNPLLRETRFKISGKPALVNDLFRVVHDYFGHVKEGVGFRAAGEENAWRAHSSMFSPLARKALTSETRGQNSWVNFGPHGEANQSADPASTHYADQKVGLLPDWVVEEGASDADIDQAQAMRRENDDHQQGVEAGEKVTVKSGKLTADERAKFKGSANPGALEAAARAIKAQYPAKAGWAPMEVKGFEEGKDGDPDKVVFEPIAYTYAHDRATGRDTRKTRRARVERLAKKLAGEIKEIQAKAESGDRTAKVQMRQSEWYRGMRKRLRAEFGGFGDVFADLLGALSPNTDVEANWKYAVQALRHFTRGEYNQQLDQLQKFVEDGGSAGSFKKAGGDVITRPDGKLYGMNSDKAMTAMLDMWRAIKPGSAPKARNFSGNLIGSSDRATIDMWAARTLQRLAGGKRIPPRAEKAVDGKFLSKSYSLQDPVGGAFGFGQDVFERASELTGIAPDNLQAIIWFYEKANWVRMGQKTKEGGSFEEEADKTEIGRYTGGVTIQQDADPSDAAMAAGSEMLVDQLNADAGVIAAKARASRGLYGEFSERTYDLEVVATKDFNPASMITTVAKVAAENNQIDAFVSKVLQPHEEVGSNARPGLEIYFKSKRALDEVMPVLQEVVEQGADGFTLVTDTRADDVTSAGKDAGGYVGVRLQYIPEISARFDSDLRAKLKADPAAIDGIIEEKMQELAEIGGSLMNRTDVNSAELVMYDTIWMGQETYGDHTSSAAEGAEKGTKGWPKLSRREAVAKAIAAIEAGERSAESVQRDDGEGIESPAFKRWFGDSKVVDESGEPLVVYHGTSEQFEAFDPEMVGAQFGQDNRGFFFTDRSAEAEGYARNNAVGMPRASRGHVVDAYLSIKNPLIESTDFDPINMWDEGHKALQERAAAEGRDGVIIRAGKGGSLFVAFDPNQIKSATDNNGEFNPDDPRINFSKGGRHVNGTTVSHLEQAAVGILGRKAFNRLVGSDGIQFVQGVQQLPANIRNKASEGDIIRAAHDRTTGRTYVVADEVTQDTLRGVLLHEIGVHHGLQGMVGAKAFKAIKAQFSRLVEQGDPAAVAAAERVPADTPKADAIEEGIAHMVEMSGAKRSTLVRRVVAAIKQWLMGMGATIKLTPADISALAEGAVRHAAKQPDPNGGPGARRAAGELSGSEALAGDVMFSRTAAETVSAIESAIKKTPKLSLKRLRNIPKQTRPAWLGALGLRHLGDIGADVLPQIKAYIDIANNMFAERNTYQERAHEWADRWRKFNGKHKESRDELANLMHDSTLAGIDPSKAFTPEKTAVLRKKIATILATARAHGHLDPEQAKALKALDEKLAAAPQRRGDYEKLKARFDKLPDEGKAIFNGIRDEYVQRQTDMEEELTNRIDRIEGPESARTAMKERMRLHFETAKVQGPYFPLARFGDYFVSATTKEGEKVFLMFESVTDQQRAMEALEKEGAGDIEHGKRIEQSKAMAGASGGFMTEVASIIDESGGANAEEMKDQVYQMWLRTMPDVSVRKQFIHRTGKAGYSGDALRAFAKQAFHGSYAVSKIKYGDQLQNQLHEMKEAAKTASDPEKAADLYNEMEKRHSWVMEPTNARWVSTTSSVGFAWYLGASPAAALINVTQTPLVALPVIGAKHGITKTGRELMRAMKGYMSGKGDIRDSLSAEERQAYDQLEREGVISRTLSHDLAGIGESDMDAYRPNQYKAMQVVSFMFHHAEVLNREVTSVAAYRLARQSGQSHEAAIGYARDATYESHFDYQNANRPRWMQSNAAKVLLMFRQYSSNMTYLLWRNFYKSMKGESPEVRKEARKVLAGVLGGHALITGSMGLPLFGVVAMVSNAMASAFGDDDEPWDFATEYQNFLTDIAGDDVGRVLATGVGGLTGADIHSRLKLDGLWIRSSDKDLEGKDAAAYWLEQIAGPMFGIAANAATGMSMISDGEVQRGMEKLVPKFVRDGLRAIRYADEGATTYRGDPLVDDVSGWEVFLQANGLTPEKISHQYDRNSSMRLYERRVLTRRRSLINAAALSRMAGDSHGMAEARRKILAFNKKYPETKISTKTVTRSIRSRQGRSERTEGGVTLSRKLNDRIRDQVGF